MKTQSLAKKFELSRVGIYWFLKNWEELLDLLMARWSAKNTGSIHGSDVYLAHAMMSMSTFNEIAVIETKGELPDP